MFGTNEAKKHNLIHGKSNIPVLMEGVLLACYRQIIEYRASLIRGFFNSVV
jgi:hypothetical protein